MAWDFETDPEYQKQLDWADEFVREEVEPLDYLFPHKQFDPMTDEMRRIIDPLKDEVRRQGLWATHLGPELGGQGFGQLKLALLNEILGRTLWASVSCVAVTARSNSSNGFRSSNNGYLLFRVSRHINEPVSLLRVACCVLRARQTRNT